MTNKQDNGFYSLKSVTIFINKLECKWKKTLEGDVK